ncbi:MAG: ATP-binding protein [Minisyncoccota bacterium]
MHEDKGKPGDCVECGNAPVNHFAMYLFQTTEVIFGRLAYRATPRARAPHRIVRWIKKIAKHVTRWHHAVGERFQIITYGKEPTGARSYRSQVIWEEAIRRGIRVEQMIVWGRRTDTYRTLHRGTWRHFNSIPIPEHFSLASTVWFDDKYILKEHLRAAGVAVPKSGSATTIEEALHLYKSIGGTVIVKPQTGSRGRHTTTYVNTEEELVRAFTSAKKLCAWVCIEEHVKGGVCRATVVEGKLVGFFQGYPPRITGNGKDTVEVLVEEQNERRHKRVQPVVLTSEHDMFLSRQGYSRASILPEGLHISLSHRTGRLFGGETRELLSTVHPRIQQEVERAAVLLDTPVVGFDVIIHDPEADPREQRWGIIEANSLPFIDLHYLPLFGTPSNPAAAVWDMWEKN